MMGDGGGGDMKSGGEMGGRPVGTHEMHRPKHQGE